MHSPSPLGSIHHDGNVSSSWLLQTTSLIQSNCTMLDSKQFEKADRRQKVRKGKCHGVTRCIYIFAHPKIPLTRDTKRLFVMQVELTASDTLE